MTAKENDDVLLDDGKYFVQRNLSNPPAADNGFLMRRCRHHVTGPVDVECVGGYDLSGDGQWLVDVATPDNGKDNAGSRVIGRFGTRLEAIHALWQHRHEALTRQSRY
ncbi:hypothetical protein BZM26_37570 [Paraburkholderia strydomiana]|nr:hypothetical protein BZM26_37570 [Paraburkholderia strydomiana]